MIQGNNLDRDSKLKLLNSYKRAEDIIELGHTLVNLSPGKDNGLFSGGFREVGDSLYGHFIYKKEGFIQRLGIKPKVSHYEIVVSHDQFLISHYDDSPELVGTAWHFNHTKQLNDSFDVFQDFMTWADNVDPFFNDKLDKAMRDEIKNSSKITIVPHHLRTDNNTQIKKLAAEFAKAGKIVITQSKEHNAYDTIITARINNNNPLTNDDLTAFTDLGAMIIKVSFKNKKSP